MQIAVSSNDTSKPAYFVMAALRWLDPILGARLKPDPATSIRGAAASDTPPQSRHLRRPRSVERGRLEARRADVQLLLLHDFLGAGDDRLEIGRASCRARVCQYVSISGGAAS